MPLQTMQNIYIYIYIKCVSFFRLGICIYTNLPLIEQIINNKYVNVEISDGNKQQIYWQRCFPELFISVLILL